MSTGASGWGKDASAGWTSRVVRPDICPACGNGMVPNHSRVPRAESYVHTHCAPCATGIERRNS